MKDRGYAIQAFGSDRIQVLLLTPTPFERRDRGVEQGFDIALLQVEGLAQCLDQRRWKTRLDLLQAFRVLEQFSIETETPERSDPDFTRFTLLCGRTPSGGRGIHDHYLQMNIFFSQMKYRLP
ncbi:hypothetical protein D3C86_1710440 [compost metagenome]